MPTCKKCNQENENSNSFCVYCGSPIDPQNQGIQEPQHVQQQPQHRQQQPQHGQQQPHGQQPVYNQQPMPPASPHYQQTPYNGGMPVYDVLPIIKKIATSGLYLTATILYTLSTIFTIILPIINSSPANTLYPAAAVAGQMAGTLLASIIPILHLVGLWMFYSQSRNPLNRSTSAFTMHKVGIILIMVLLGILALCIPIIIIIALFGISQFGAAGVIIAIIVIVAILILAIPFIFYSLSLRVIGGIKHAILYGEAKLKSVTAVAIFCFIFGGISVLSSIGLAATEQITQSLLSEFVSSETLAPSVGGMQSVVGTIAILMSSTSFILFGVLLLKYKGAVTNSSTYNR